MSVKFQTVNGPSVVARIHADRDVSAAVRTSTLAAKLNFAEGWLSARIEALDPTGSRCEVERQFVAASGVDEMESAARNSRSIRKREMRSTESLGRRLRQNRPHVQVLSIPGGELQVLFDMLEMLDDKVLGVVRPPRPDRLQDVAMFVVRAACGVVVAIEADDQARACHQFLDDPLQDDFAGHPDELNVKLAGEANGGPAAAVTIVASFDEAVAAGSSLTVVLDNGASVVLSTISGSTVSGTYTVGATGSGEDSADLTVASISAMSVSDAAANEQTSTGACRRAISGTPAPSSSTPRRRADRRRISGRARTAAPPAATTSPM